MKVNLSAKFDFDTANLTQSPCKTCSKRHNLPACIKKCELINTVQLVLASTITCSHKLQDNETFTPNLPRNRPI